MNNENRRQGDKYFAERIILVAATAILLGLMTWVGTKITDTSEKVAVIYERISTMMVRLDRLEQKR